MQWGEDRRFDEMRSNLGKLAIFWIFQVDWIILLKFHFAFLEVISSSPFHLIQAVWVWTVSLPVTVVNASNHNPSLRPADVIGWIMWFVGVVIEAMADQQKLAFKNSPENRGKWCNVGLWKVSRHPNYFGEVRSLLKVHLFWNWHVLFPYAFSEY